MNRGKFNPLSDPLKCCGHRGLNDTPVTKSALFPLVLSLCLAQSDTLAADYSVARTNFADTKAAGDAALDGHNYGRAESLLTQALSQAQHFGAADPRVAEALHSLVSLYMARGQFAKAEPLLERELRVNEKILGAEHPQVVTEVGKYAEFCYQHGSKDKADKLVRLLVTFAERRLKQEQNLDVNFANLSNWYKKNKVYQPAQSTLTKLQEETRQALGDENIEFAAALDSLARLYVSAGKHEQAESLLLKALNLRQLALPPNHLALAASYQSLGNVYQSEGRSEAAAEYFKKALVITEKTVPEENDQVFNKIDSLARQEISAGHKSQAEALYKQALDKSGAATGQSGDAVFALAQLYASEGRYAAAEPLLKRALRLAEAKNGPSQASVAPILQTYADVLEKLDRKGEAAKLRRRACAILGTAGGQM